MKENIFEKKKIKFLSSEEIEYTLEDLEKELQWDSGFGPNNPKAVMREYGNHLTRLKNIRDYLIKKGLLQKPELTDEEKITASLDKLYPNAKSKSIVEYRGKKYQIKYSPLKETRSGKVLEWEHCWEEVKK